MGNMWSLDRQGGKLGSVIIEGSGENGNSSVIHQKYFPIIYIMLKMMVDAHTP